MGASYSKEVSEEVRGNFVGLSYYQMSQMISESTDQTSEFVLLAQAGHAAWQLTEVGVLVCAL